MELNIKKLIIASSVIVLGILIVWLLLTGRLNAIGALIIAIVTILSRSKFWYSISKYALKFIYSINQFKNNSSKYNNKKKSYYTKNSNITILQASKILGVKIDASEEEIKKAWRNKLHAAHPDKGGSSNRVQKLNNAKDKMLFRFK